MGPTPVARVGLAPFLPGRAGVHTPRVDTTGRGPRGPLVSAPAVLSRLLVVVLLAVCIGGVYLLLPVGFGALVGWGPNTVLSVAATALVAIGYGPVRDRVTR